MELSLLIQICGIPLLIVLAALGLALTAIAIFLAVRVKNIPLLIAFLPITALPVMAGFFSTLQGVLESISTQLNPNQELVVEPGFLLLMNLVPILAGILVAIPPTLISIGGRWVLTWRASGARLLPQRQTVEVEHEEPLEQDAEDYLRKLVRPR